MSPLSFSGESEVKFHSLFHFMMKIKRANRIAPDGTSIYLQALKVKTLSKLTITSIKEEHNKNTDLKRSLIELLGRLKTTISRLVNGSSAEVRGVSTLNAIMQKRLKTVVCLHKTIKLRTELLKNCYLSAIMYI